ncbi:hypothetical protein [Christiangramia echinicola]|uniref:Uncharacterized protein n=1 Tax=Christiangramia echinicola TaxID=279359 RepID=A0A1H1KUY6_9FLAO|nr:hypothetical protein [Christiangramia echinicola]SDR66046.1 hypothetical protein SAMN04488552_0232 [Christiangramia echinicola]
MRKILFYIIILITISSCKDKAAIKEQKKPTDTISYRYSGFNHHRKLELLSNKNFILLESSASCFGDYKIYRHFGTYQQNDSLIKLEPKLVEIETYNSIVEKDTTYEIPYSDSLKIKTIYQKLHWNNKRYLLSEQIDSIVYPESKNDFEQFAFSYNSGEEPEFSGNYLIREDENSSDSINQEIPIENLPKEYQDLFLKNPISTKIIDREKLVFNDEDVDVDLIKWRVKLDKGSIDGLRKGMQLITSNNEFFIFIDSIAENYSYGECYVYNIESKYSKIGTEMKSRWED